MKRSFFFTAALAAQAAVVQSLAIDLDPITPADSASLSLAAISAESESVAETHSSLMTAASAPVESNNLTAATTGLSP